MVEEIYIRNNTFRQLKGMNSGGGIYMFHTKQYFQFPVIDISENVFLYNEAIHYGGGIALESLAYIDQSLVQVVRNTFISNSAIIGGGMYLRNLYPSKEVIASNTFNSNVAATASTIY